MEKNFRCLLSVISPRRRDGNDGKCVFGLLALLSLWLGVV